MSRDMPIEPRPPPHTRRRSYRALPYTLALASALPIVALCSCAPGSPGAAPRVAAREPGAGSPGAKGSPVVAGASSASAPGAMRPSEAALRRLITSLQRGEPVVDQVNEELARAVQSPRFRGDVVNLGEVESVVFEKTGPQGFDIYQVSSKTGLSVWRIKLGPDGKAAGVFLRVMEKPPAEPLTQAQFAAALEQRLLAEAAKDEFSGVVLVARDDKPIFQRAIGLADREQGIPNQLETKFRIGSMNKMFTAVAILQLVQAGKLALSDPLGKHLKNYPNADVATQVTIEHLLTHTGGTGDIFGPEFAQHKHELRTHADYAKLFGERGLAFTPGTEWQYSNYGFVLLGAVIERVTGQSYYDYVEQHVYAPAGMKNTGSFPEGQRVPLRSLGYTRFRVPGTESSPGTKWFSNAGVLPYRGTAAGGGYSTARDLLAFARALEQHRLLDAEHTARLTTPKPGPAEAAGYAYGFARQTELGVSCHGHGGGAPGMNGELLVCRPAAGQSEFVIVTLANLDPPAAQRVAEFARTRLPAAPEAQAQAPGGACRDRLLDDLEDGDAQALGSPRASGVWKSFKDTEGTRLSPEPFASSPGGAQGSKHAAHIAGTTGKARATWAGLEIAAAGEGPDDLSPWARVCFRARGTGRVRFDVVDANTSPAGGICQRCYNNFGAFFSLSPSWEEHCFRFEELTQAGHWGEPLPAVAPEKVYSLSWSIRSRATDYDLWIDDVRLACE